MVGSGRRQAYVEKTHGYAHAPLYVGEEPDLIQARIDRDDSDGRKRRRAYPRQGDSIFPSCGSPSFHPFHRPGRLDDVDQVRDVGRQTLFTGQQLDLVALRIEPYDPHLG